MYDDEKQKKADNEDLKRKLRYVTSEEIIKIAEDDLTAAEELGAMLEDDPCEENEPQFVRLSKARLTAKEVRAIYDDLPDKDRANVKELARKFVAMVKRDKPFTAYDFDDGLMDVARLGVFICA
jgi:hypothetical protein